MRVLIQKEGEMFVGQCLEHDICAQGCSVDELMSRLVLTVDLECSERNGSLADIDPAPEEFHKMWDNARRLADEQCGYEVALAA
ncbi:hypothetical protein ROJ8625_03769 [Roseivivax jejudonensis]|uniref:HicB-like antitoxin of toxin-antitoxin system domain-containing protein n=1 Tax=Roseivivax jejudonensis TaxID=1529041 RepID=A0A1X7A735_9RHOB|nr:hypothetical protein [Roseivivax jejudonensis]SLN72002.1 hypothetical protein ROJ8625_03769 [Roseivivax jejudonensis]